MSNYFGTALDVQLDAYRTDRTIEEVLQDRFPSNGNGGVAFANARTRREIINRLREWHEPADHCREPVGADLY